MTHTRIIAADGTAYIPEGIASRRRRRWVIGFIALLLSPFLAAAFTGIAIGAYRTASPAPTLSPRLTAAIKACTPAPAPLRDDCTALALRRPFHNATISDPDGTALAKECLSDTSLTNDELLACLTQPAN
jgi:hypothetical protein